MVDNLCFNKFQEQVTMQASQEIKGILRTTLDSFFKFVFESSPFPTREQELTIVKFLCNIINNHDGRVLNTNSCAQQSQLLQQNNDCISNDSSENLVRSTVNALVLRLQNQTAIRRPRTQSGHIFQGKKERLIKGMKYVLVAVHRKTYDALIGINQMVGLRRQFSVALVDVLAFALLRSSTDTCQPDQYYTLTKSILQLLYGVCAEKNCETLSKSVTELCISIVEGTVSLLDTKTNSSSISEALNLLCVCTDSEHLIQLLETNLLNIGNPISRRLALSILARYVVRCTNNASNNVKNSGDTSIRPAIVEYCQKLGQLLKQQACLDSNGKVRLEAFSLIINFEIQGVIGLPKKEILFITALLLRDKSKSLRTLATKTLCSLLHTTYPQLERAEQARVLLWILCQSTTRSSVDHARVSKRPQSINSNKHPWISCRGNVLICLMTTPPTTTNTHINICQAMQENINQLKELVPALGEVLNHFLNDEREYIQRHINDTIKK